MADFDIDSYLHDRFASGNNQTMDDLATMPGITSSVREMALEATTARKKAALEQATREKTLAGRLGLRADEGSHVLPDLSCYAWSLIFSLMRSIREKGWSWKEWRERESQAQKGPRKRAWPLWKRQFNEWLASEGSACTLHRDEQNLCCSCKRDSSDLGESILGLCGSTQEGPCS